MLDCGSWLLEQVSSEFECSPPFNVFVVGEDYIAHIAHVYSEYGVGLIFMREEEGGAATSLGSINRVEHEVGVGNG